MIQEVTIKNFKSVQELTLPLSRFNVLIGSNGSGKSNILEAIAFGGAASANKLDNEFLGSRGIRTSEARLMKSAFASELGSRPIELLFKNVEEDLTIHSISFTIEEEEGPILKWDVKEHEDSKRREILFMAFFQHDIDRINGFDFIDNHVKETLKTLFTLYQKAKKNKDEETESRVLFKLAYTIPQIFPIHLLGITEISNFIIYSPEISALRKLEEESQIQPLGIKGEGLFNLLQIFNESYGEETINELKKYLNIIEWFDDFEAVYDKATERKSLVVKDRFMPGVSLNHHNVNEGFLFLLFYISLIISKETPSFFAIDNIEASFHPRLCEELIKQLIELAKIHNKQLILTTHNPYVLDGLNLQDNEQSLFVVRRNADGETIADKITRQSKNVKLSEAWVRGYIGGQPETIE